MNAPADRWAPMLIGAQHPEPRVLVRAVIGAADLRRNLADVLNAMAVYDRITYLSNQGRRIAAIVPVQVAEAALVSPAPSVDRASLATSVTVEAEDLPSEPPSPTMERGRGSETGSPVDVLGATIGVTGILGTLGGVALGGWLSGRRERLLQRLGHQREERQGRLAACVEFLAAYRQFRAVILTEDPEVVVPPGRPAGAEVAFIRGMRSYSDAAQCAGGRLLLLEGGQSPIVDAAAAVVKAFWALAVARGKHGPGPLADDLVAAAREAEREFARVAQRETPTGALRRGVPAPSARLIA